MTLDKQSKNSRMAHINRQIRNRLLKSLDVSPIVFLNGPRQAGKSTLVQAIAI